MLGRFAEDLTALQRAIRFGDGDTLFKMFTEARSVRRGIIQAGQDTAAPDFGRAAKTKPAPGAKKP
jgi:cyclohexadieny/prephenate dehydrogenase